MGTTSHVYELRLRGGASDLARAAFDDVEVCVSEGQTVLRTSTIDSAALYWLISRIESLGLVLVDMAALDSEPDTPKERNTSHG